MAAKKSSRKTTKKAVPAGRVERNVHGRKVLLPKVVMDASALLASDAMTAKPEQLSLLQQAETFRVLDEVEKRVKKRREALRVAILGVVQAQGETTPKGGQELNVEGHRLLREKREATQPDPEGVSSLLRSLKIPLGECFDEVKTFQLNASKLEFLMQTGKVPRKQVGALHKVSWALRVQANKELNEQLEALG